jgi:hypothetical protein
VPVPDEIPEGWHADAEARTGGRLSTRLLEESEPEVPASERARADAEGDRVVDEARMVLL